MYEKLCAILDALREEGFTVKAEYDCHYGAWCIIGTVPRHRGLKGIQTDAVIRYPVESSRIMSYSFNVQTVVEEIMKEVYA